MNDKYYLYRKVTDNYYVYRPCNDYVMGPVSYEMAIHLIHYYNKLTEDKCSIKQVLLKEVEYE